MEQRHQLATARWRGWARTYLGIRSGLVEAWTGKPTGNSTETNLGSDTCVGCLQIVFSAAVRVETSWRQEAWHLVLTFSHPGLLTGTRRAIGWVPNCNTCLKWIVGLGPPFYYSVQVLVCLWLTGRYPLTMAWCVLAGGLEVSFQWSVASLMSVYCVATVTNLMGTLSGVWCCQCLMVV